METIIGIPAWIVVLVFGWLSLLSIPASIATIHWLLKRRGKDA